MNAPRSPYRQSPSALDETRRGRSGERAILLSLAFVLAAIPFIQLAVTGDASQTDLGVSVLLLFPIASWWLEDRARRRRTAATRR